jgi:Outer membrane protein beta-barrel domain
MKKIVFSLFFFALAMSATHAQKFDWGIRGGVSTPDVTPADLSGIIIKRTSDSLNLKVKDANYGLHGGVWARLRLGKFFIQPEVVFNSSTVTYSLDSIRRGVTNVLKDGVKETFSRVDVPIMLGFKLASFRLNAGPVGHFNIGSSSDLTTVSGFSTKLKSAQWGFQVGLGADFGRLGLDLRYEGNADNFGSHINFGNNSYEFSRAPSRIVLSAAIRF